MKEIRRPDVKGDSSTNQFVFKILDIELTKELVMPNSKAGLSIRNVGKTVSPKFFENVCRKELGRYFGVSLRKRTVQGVPKEFDMVSMDGKFVGDAKYFTMVKGERIPPAKFSIIAEYVWLLEKTLAVHKFLVFGNDHRVPTEWLKRYGHLAKNVAFFFLDVPTRKIEKLN